MAVGNLPLDGAGVEVGFRVAVTPEVHTDVSYSYFGTDDEELKADVKTAANRPPHRGSVSITYLGAQGLDFAVNLLFLDSFDFVASGYFGRVPARQTVNVTAGYQVNNYLRLHAVATNLLDQRRFHAYGASVIGRRVLGGVTATF